MKKKIYDFMCGKHNLSIHEISASLGIDEVKVFNAINEFLTDGIVKLEKIVPIDINNDESCYYTLTGKSYKEN